MINSFSMLALFPPFSLQTCIQNVHLWPLLSAKRYLSPESFIPEHTPPLTHTHTRTHACTHPHTHTLRHTHTHTHTYTCTLPDEQHNPAVTSASFFPQIKNMHEKKNKNKKQQQVKKSASPWEARDEGLTPVAREGGSVMTRLLLFFLFLFLFLLLFCSRSPFSSPKVH